VRDSWHCPNLFLGRTEVGLGGIVEIARAEVGLGGIVEIARAEVGLGGIVEIACPNSDPSKLVRGLPTQ